MDTMTTDRELRPYTPNEVARLVQVMREGLGWSQETLAELAKLNTRTIQRVEAGEGASDDTKQAVCRAFQLDDPHWLSRRHEILNQEGAEREASRIRNGFVAVNVYPVADGRSLLRRISEDHPGVGLRAVSPGNIGQPSKAAEDRFAELVDTMTATLGDLEDMGMTEMLAAGDGLQPMLDALAAEGWRIRLGSRIANVKAFPHQLAISYVVLAPRTSETSTVLAPRMVPAGAGRP